MKIAANFMKEVPVEKREIVKRKLDEFAKILPKNKALTDLPKGFWVRQVAGTNIYKFRVNSGDRILFRYEKSEAIVFLSFQTHDKQIQAAKNISPNMKLEDFNIVHEEYIEEEIDAKIDYYARNELQNHLNQILTHEVFDDEYIELTIESNSNEQLLSMEQYNCLKEIENPIIIFGCAGSGKTSIAIRKMLLDYELSKQTVYATKSEMIIQKAKDLIPKDLKDQLHFLTLKDMLSEELELELEELIIVEYDDFINWALKDDISELTRGFPVKEIWIEINTVIKGASGERLMPREEYLTGNESAYPDNIKRMIYSVAGKYDIWLKLKGYYDYNDLAHMTLSRKLKNQYENIIFDEVQELTNKQLKYLLNATLNKQSLLLLGDIHQATQNYHFNLTCIKDELFQEGWILKELFINKNYRSNYHTVKAINKLKEIKQSKFRIEGECYQQLEIPVRSGLKPFISRGTNSTLELIKKLQNDVNSILVISERREKEHFEGMGIKRVFTIEETRGLEYDSVYTYNILTTFNEIWKILFSDGNKLNELYKTYINLVYLAITRSKKSLFMIEDENTILENALQGFLEYKEISLDNVQASTNEDWIKEAQKLFKLKKYSQAADAYEKAGDNRKRDLCTRLYNHDELYELNNRYQCFLKIELDQCTIKHLEVCLDCLFKKFGVRFKGYFEMRINYKQAKGYRTPKVFIQPYLTNAEVANLLYEQLQEQVLDKRNLICKGTLFVNDLPVQLSSMTGGVYEDIIIVIKGNEVKISTVFLQQEREFNSFLVKIDEISKAKRQQIYGNYGYDFVERSKEKYRDKIGKEILSCIFQGNFKS